MVNIHDAFPSKYLKHGDLHDKATDTYIPRIATISMVQMELLDREQKIVVYFAGDALKPLVLNKTNAAAITAMYGPETDYWGGNPVEVFVADTEFGGKPQKGLRVRAPQQVVPQQNVVPNANPATQNPYQQAQQGQQQPAQQYDERNPPPHQGNPMDDEIPF